MALHEELRAFEFHAGSIVNGLASLDAEHHVLRMSIFFTKVVAVIGRNQRQAHIFFKPEQSGMNAVLHRQALVLNFEIEIVFAENVAMSGGRVARGFVVPFHQPLGNFSLEAAGEADQSAGMFRKKFLAHARFVVKAMQ